MKILAFYLVCALRGLGIGVFARYKLPPEGSERYFFVSYRAENKAHWANGSLSVASPNFPSNTSMRSTIKNILKERGRVFAIDDVVITSLLEFENKKDFDTYTSEEENK